MNSFFRSGLGLLLGLLLIGATDPVNAMWAKMSDEELVTRSDVILVGTITTLGPHMEPRFDVATIQVEQVLMGNKDLSEVFLLVPARDRNIKSSTDLLYAKGQRGLWFLQQQPGTRGEFYLADHPQRLQPTEQAERVKEFLRAR